MTHASAVGILELLGLAYQNGVQLSASGAALDIKVPQGRAVEPAVLEKLQQNQEVIYRYFLSREKDPQMDRTLAARTDHVKAGNHSWYHIPKMHHHFWWVDASVEVEFKKNVYLRRAFEIKGELDFEVARRTLHFILRRHELLRTTFRAVDGKYYMRIKSDAELNDGIAFLDVSGPAAGKQEKLDVFVNFTGHEIDIYEGPFFWVRVAKVEDEQYIISFKAHHSIYDLWSLEVLQRDIVTAYTAFQGNCTPDLPRLHYQYKDYTYLDYCYKKQLSDQHRQYWLAQHGSLQPELQVPGEKDGPAAGRESAYFNSRIPEALKKRLESTAVRKETSLFIVLQAMFKAYLQECTGQNDIVIGTMLFNRDGFVGLENQIGPYAKTVIIRSRLTSGMLEEVIETVKKSNADLNQYNAFTLLDTFVEMLPEGCPAGGTFWKICLFYQDVRGFGMKVPAHRKPSGFEIAPYPLRAEKSTPNIDIEIRFINAGDRIDLKVIYDGNKYSTDGIGALINGYLRFLKAAG